MKRFSSKNFNIPRLLTLGDLDIRGIAADNPELSAREYFMWIEWFIEDAPKYIDDLTLASDPAKLEAINDALSEIGYNKLKSEIETIIGEIKSGELDRAKNRSAYTLSKFKGFYERLKIAYAVKKRGADKIITTELFIEEALNYICALEDASEPSELEKIKRPLSRLGYNDLNSDIDAIIKEIENKRTQQAKNQGKEASKKLADYYGRIKSAYLSINSEYARQFKPNPNDIVLLQEALEYFDFEESHRKLRILAVDDNVILLNSVTSILSPYYEVFALPKASQVEKFLTHTTPELFLLDIEMPELNGYDLVSVIRSFDNHKDTPIIFLTASATMENIKSAVSLGVSDFITKPITNDVLLKKIENKIVWKKAF